MRILMLHNRYLQRGGEDTTVEDEIALLQAHGHQVDLLLWDNQTVLQRPLWRTALDTLWSSSAYRRVARALQAQRYDLVHVHNFFPLASPAVLYAAHAADVPVIQTLHNYRLLCLNGYLLREGQPCEACLRHRWPYPGIRHRCYRQSLPGSITVAAMLTLHRLLRTWQRQVDLFMTFTHFARQKFIQGGLPPGRLMVAPHFVHPDPGVGEEKRRFVLFIGRLDTIKGADLLLRAWLRLRPQVPLLFIGEGPLSPTLQKQAQGLAVRFLGWRPHAEVLDYLRQALLLVVPSRFRETFGRVVVEAYAAGTPVVVTDHGALAELVEPGQTGWRFRYDDVEDLARRLAQALQDPMALRRMGAQARRTYERHYTAAEGYRHLMAVYRRAQELHRQETPTP